MIWECALRADDLSELLGAVATELKTGESTYREWPKLPTETQEPV